MVGSPNGKKSPIYHTKMIKDHSKRLVKQGNHYLPLPEDRKLQKNGRI